MQAQKAGGAQHDIHDHALLVEFKDLLHAERAVSREIEVGGLIETLLTIAINLVSAKRGLLFLARGREPEVEAEATTQGGSVRVAFAPALTPSPKFPQTVLRYVVRMEESVVLDDAVAKNQFSDDDYLRGGSTRSILCFPLTAQRNLVGVLYLENALAPHAFACERLVALELLASQAAVSLRTAALGVNLAHEIKERRKADTELERFHRMYGEAHLNGRNELTRGLTAALAHELNQPLGAIRSNAQGVRRLLDAPRPDLAKAKAAIEDIIEDNSRAVEMVRNVRSIFQRDAIEMAAVNLLQILHDVARMVRADSAQRGIAIRLDLPASLPDVIGNKTQLVQVMMNLILNAFEAMCQRRKREGTRELVISARQCESRHVHVAIRDSGTGIDPEIMPQLFKPFFTTKHNGMGLGLAIVRSIIENHRGRLQATRNPDSGATLEFELPVNGQ